MFAIQDAYMEPWLRGAIRGFRFAIAVALATTQATAAPSRSSSSLIAAGARTAFNFRLISITRKHELRQGEVTVTETIREACLTQAAPRSARERVQIATPATTAAAIRSAVREQA